MTKTIDELVESLLTTDVIKRLTTRDEFWWQSSCEASLWDKRKMAAKKRLKEEILKAKDNSEG